MSRAFSAVPAVAALRRATSRLALPMAVAAAAVTAAPPASAFDLDTGNAPFEVIIPTAIPVILEDTSARASDPSLIFRITALVTNGWFDAIAPYHPTAVGVYSRFPQRLTDATNRKRNIAILHSSYHTFSSLYPKRRAVWAKMLTDHGLDPANDSADPTTPEGVGNIAGKAVVAARLHDGMNQLGDEGGRRYHREPYADHTGYRPVNTAYRVFNPSRWQPSLVSLHNGLFNVQHFVTPQLGRTKPYSYADPDEFRSPFPVRSQFLNYWQYKSQADEVLAASAALTDEQKAAAELFDHKFNSVFGAVGFTVQSRGLDLVQSVHVEFLTNVSSFDAAIAVWRDKYRYDAVRPFTAIHVLYGRQKVRAWGGPGKGTVDDMPGNEWRAYLDVANHPEYPSGTAAFCAAHAEVMRSYMGTDDLGFSVTMPRGTSVVEPGVTPASDVTLSWSTWSDLSETCGLSRFWGGVHFLPSIPAGQEVGRRVGQAAYQFVQRHIDGQVP